MDIEEN